MVFVFLCGKLFVNFFVDDGLEVMYYSRVWVWVSYGVDVIECISDIGYLIVQGVVYGVFQCVMIRGYRYNFSV